MVEQVADVDEAEEPSVGGGTSSVHDCIDPKLEVLDASFHGVLELFEGFTEPTSYH